jgi:NSS family neurotransmitter:Na+ symporter
MVNAGGESLRAGLLFEWILKYLIPLEFVVMFGWWMYQAAAVYDPTGWWNPVHIFSVGTCVMQWGVALLLMVVLNRRLAVTSRRGLSEVEA